MFAVAGLIAGRVIVAGSVRPAWTQGGLRGERAGSDTPDLPLVVDSSTISRMRAVEVRPRRTGESVQPSARVGHVRYAREPVYATSAPTLSRAATTARPPAHSMIW